MNTNYGNPALEAELAYRRAQVQAARAITRNGRGRWLPVRRRSVS